MKSTCFICGSTNIEKGKCLDCGYEFEFEFPCPFHDEVNVKCKATRKRCTKRFDYYDCNTYMNEG